jgi:DNA-binding GntR family transcriptional regulator
MLAERGLQPGGRIPAEQELVALLGLGRSTVREALRALQVPSGYPLVQLDQAHVDTQKRPAFFSCSYWRTDHFAFRVLRRVQD